MNQHQLNIEIQQFMNEKAISGDDYTPSEIAYIQQYAGSGGMQSKGAKGSGILHEFYTPDYICDLVHHLAYKYGYDGGTILEPSIATGRLIKPFADKTKVVGFEISTVASKICQITYPQATIYNEYFEVAFMSYPRINSRLKGKITWLEQYPFSLVIGNPPFGIYKNYYSSYFRNPGIKLIEHFFMYYGLLLLKPGGLLVYLTGSNFLRNGITYNKEKELIGIMADLVDAYRLPSVFDKTDISTDIIILRKK